MRQDLGRGFAHGAALAAAALALACLWAGQALAATPSHGTLTLSPSGKGKVAFKGTVSSTLASVGATGDSCFDSGRHPDPSSGCDFYVLNVKSPESILQRFIGSINVTANGFGSQDVDVYVYVHNPSGTKGYQIMPPPDNPAAGQQGAGTPEKFPIENPFGAAKSYWVVIVPYQALPGTHYNGAVAFKLKPAKPSLKALNRRLGPGPKNYRASHDRYISHSEPSIAMDPTNHKHLIAGSKMYENLEEYLFKAGTYESFNGGRTWKDWGQLPGYCQGPGQCNPRDEEHYRTVSDISLAFDDEGNAYSNTLDAPGGTLSFTGFNMTVNIKRPHKRWTGPIVVHDNQRNALTQELLLDDKNWIAVDNHTDVNGGPNKPHDHKIGTIYVCWSFDSSTIIPAQQIVLMRSTDGGHTWGGTVPGDNTPKQLSQKGAISGIGCQEAIGPHGEVYVTWYDNQLGDIMQVKSTDRGQTFTPARPIASITGVNDQFPGQEFRNLSIPTSAVDGKGNVYVAVASQNAEGAPAVGGQLEQSPKHPHVNDPRDEGAAGETTGKPGSGADIVLFKSTDGGNTYTGPVRVNHDIKTGDADQFQPWMAVTPKGQVDVSYFDRRNDHNGLFIDTYLSRSNDGGQHFKDTRVTHRVWDPRINPPTSTSGEFIGDYQGIVADDKFAIPFWNDTQAANLLRRSRGYSPWQQVYSARIPNDPKHGGPAKRRRKPKHR